MFLKKASTYFVGTLSSKILSVLLVPIYAYYVSAEALGEYDYVLTISNIVMPIAFLSVWEAILRYCMKENAAESQRRIVSSSIGFSVAIIAVLTLLCLGINLFYSDKKFILCLYIFVIIQGITYIWQYSARSFGESKQFVISGVASSAVLIVSNIVNLAVLKLEYKGLVLSFVLSHIVTILVLEYKIKLIPNFRISEVSLEIIKKLLKFSVPLVVNAISLWLYSGSSRIIIRNYIGSYENGLYSFASKFSLVITLFSTVISMAVIEEAYSYKTLEEYSVKLSALIEKVSKAYFSLVMLAVPAINILYTIAFKKTDYYKSADYVFLLLLTALFTALANNYGSAFQVTDKTKYITFTTLLGAISAIILSLILVRPIGIYGILIGGTAGPFLMMLSRAVYAKKATGLKVNWGKNIIFAAIAGIISLSFTQVKNIFFQSGILVVLIIYLAIEYKNEIAIIYKKVFQRGDAVK